jgi:hypothetical protein
LTSNGDVPQLHFLMAKQRRHATAPLIGWAGNGGVPHPPFLLGKQWQHATASLFDGEAMAACHALPFSFPGVL